MLYALYVTEQINNFQKQDEDNQCQCRFFFKNRNTIIAEVIALEIGPISEKK